MHSGWKTVTGLAIGVLVGACQPGIPPAGAGTYLSAPSARVRVINHHWATVNVYLVYGGARVRLGSLSSMAEEEFRVSSGLGAGGDLRLMVDPIGSVSSAEELSYANDTSSRSQAREPRVTG